MLKKFIRDAGAVCAFPWFSTTCAFKDRSSHVPVDFHCVAGGKDGLSMLTEVSDSLAGGNCRQHLIWKHCVGHLILPGRV